jgi:hypothetical protein
MKDLEHPRRSQNGSKKEPNSLHVLSGSLDLYKVVIRDRSVGAQTAYPLVDERDENAG